MRTIMNILSQPAPHRLPILLYHNVGRLPVEDPHGLTVTPEQFERQMQWLVSRGYETIWPSDWLAAHKEGKPLPRNPIVLTFDDGYAEMVEYALPVLRRHGLKAAVYVVTRRLGLTNTWDEMNGRQTMRLMTADQVRQLPGQGIELGSHSRTHSHLTSLSESQLADEIEGSKNDLQNLLGAEVLSFAYPYGDGADSRIIREKLMRSYQLGMTVWDGPNSIESNPYELRRIAITPGDSLRDFERKLRFKKTVATLVCELVPLTARRAVRSGARALRLWRA
ncbi:MAG: polysaccharide deacetylase family protein [Candidatus Binataceae bacterium]